MPKVAYILRMMSYGGSSPVSSLSTCGLISLSMKPRSASRNIRSVSDHSYMWELQSVRSRCGLHDRPGHPVAAATSTHIERVLFCPPHGHLVSARLIVYASFHDHDPPRAGCRLGRRRSPGPRSAGVLRPRGCQPRSASVYRPFSSRWPDAPAVPRDARTVGPRTHVGEGDRAGAATRFAHALAVAQATRVRRLITRTRSAADERQLVVELTEAGKALRTQADASPAPSCSDSV